MRQLNSGTKEVHMMPPKVSIIIAVYNGAKTLQRCIDSITNQTYPNIELIIIDGASSDQTVDIISDNEAVISYWESKVDKGIYHAWNKALEHVNGEWIYFLGADDLLYESDTLKKFSIQVQMLSEDEKLAYGRVLMIDSLGADINYVGKPWVEVKKRFFVENTIPHQGLFHHYSLFSGRNFDLNYSISGDYEFILGAILSGCKVAFFEDLIVAKMQKGGVSNSPESSYRTLLQFLQARRKHGIEGISYLFIWILIKAYIKRVLFSIKGL